MNNDLARIKKEIMLRVRFVHLFKRALRPFTIEVCIFIAALFGTGKLVFVAKVLENAPEASRLQEFAMFFVQAFARTEFSVQLLMLGVVVAGAFALRDVARTISLLRRFSLRRT